MALVSVTETGDFSGSLGSCSASRVPHVHPCQLILHLFCSSTLGLVCLFILLAPCGGKAWVVVFAQILMSWVRLFRVMRVTEALPSLALVAGTTSVVRVCRGRV